MSANPGTPKIAPNHQQLGESQGTDFFPQKPPEETNRADNCISDIQPPEL